MSGTGAKPKKPAKSSKNKSTKSKKVKGGVLVYQFKITLLGINPPIWRRVQAPADYSFEYFWNVIEQAMGWIGLHCHQFHVINPSTKKVERLGMTLGKCTCLDSIMMMLKGGYEGLIDELTVTVEQYFKELNDTGIYQYDLGEKWQHEIVLEKILPNCTDRMPKFIDGQRACPPDNCGGTQGYMKLLEIILNPSHPDYKKRREGLVTTSKQGKNFDPEKMIVPDYKNFEMSRLLYTLLLTEYQNATRM